MIPIVYQFFKDFIGLLYPHLCQACLQNPPTVHAILCRTCDFNLKKTDFHQFQENIFTERFWGRLPIEYGLAMYYFTKNSKVQRLVHLLKYRGKKQIGLKLGVYYGSILRSLNHSKFKFDIIIPVPLHPAKERKRGYNQSDLFAEGLALSLEVPWYSRVLVRSSFTETQTAKSRMDRFQNVVNAFEVKKPELLKGKHILLVDDVITTGATLEACGIKLLEVEGTRVSMATIAIAKS